MGDTAKLAKVSYHLTKNEEQKENEKKKKW